MIDLRLGDCLDLLPTLEAQSIDAIIADIPYGTTACKWDTVIPFEPMWRELKRIAKPEAAIVLFGSEPFASMLRTSNIKQYKYDWYWKKEQGTGFARAKVQPLRIIENICVFGESINYYPIKTEREQPVQIHSSFRRDSQSNPMCNRVKNVRLCRDRFPNTLLNFQRDRTVELRGIHPTQKPVALMEYLVRTYTNEGDTVLDFTMGSGTTMVACVKTKRNGIGFEILPEYFEIAKKRITEAQQQMVML